MNYLLDKKIKRKKTSKVIIGVIILFFIFYFRAGIFSGLSSVAHTVFRPVLFIGRNAGEEISSISAIFHNRKSLMLENEDLKNQILQSQADRANYASVVDENNQMKEILGRKAGTTDMILAGILNKPNQSLYDTLLIDVGTEQGIVTGQRVFALGNVPVGYIAESYSSSSKVILFSNPGEKTEAIINGGSSSGESGNVSMQLVGRGGGNFEMILPRDFVLAVGTEIDLPGVTPYILGTVQSILSDPRDAFQKALIASPINIQEQKFVEIEK